VPRCGAAQPYPQSVYLRLRAAGKKPLVATTACMRKLVIIMNRSLKNYYFQLASKHRYFMEILWAQTIVRRRFGHNEHKKMKPQTSVTNA
jgi:hypothetical protein